MLHVKHVSNSHSAFKCVFYEKYAKKYVNLNKSTWGS